MIAKMRAAALIRIEQLRHLPDAEFAKAARQVIKDVEAEVAAFRESERKAHEETAKRKASGK